MNPHRVDEYLVMVILNILEPSDLSENHKGESRYEYRYHNNDTEGILEITQVYIYVHSIETCNECRYHKYD